MTQSYESYYNRPMQQPRTNMRNGTLLMPAYGRTYASNDAMREDWENGKDFRLYGSGQYCSIRDLDKLKAIWTTALIIDPRSPSQITVF